MAVITYNTNVDYFTDSPIADFIPYARLRNYPKGQIILYEGDVPSDLYIIKSGVIKVHDIDNHGNEKILHIIKAPAMFPMVFFLGGSDQTKSFYTTITDAEVYVLPKSIVKEKMQANSELAIHVMHWFSREIHEVMVRLSSLEKTNTRDKLIAALKFLGVHHAIELKDKWRRVEFPVSHQLLADMIGVTRESTTMIMKELHNEKIIRNPRLAQLEIRFAKLIEL